MKMFLFPLDFLFLRIIYHLVNQLKGAHTEERVPPPTFWCQTRRFLRASLHTRNPFLFLGSPFRTYRLATATTFVDVHLAPSTPGCCPLQRQPFEQGRYLGVHVPMQPELKFNYATKIPPVKSPAVIARLTQ